jgi:ATP synthase protein I
MWIIGLQLAVTLLAALIPALADGGHAGFSALLGGLINVVASFYMAKRVFAGGLAAGPRDWLARLWLAEAIKLGLTVALFAFAIAVLNAAFLPLILAYMATYIAYWVGLLRISFGQVT